MPSGMANTTSAFCNLVSLKCLANHTNFDLIVQGVFNCCVKNYLKYINSHPMLGEPLKKAVISKKNFIAEHH